MDFANSEYMFGMVSDNPVPAVEDPVPAEKAAPAKEENSNSGEAASEGDQGANQWVRMMLLATMEVNEDHTVPNNWGDPLIQYKYGIRYGSEAKFEYEALALPRVIKITETESNGSTTTSSESEVEAKAVGPFDIYFLMWNKGDDGITTVAVKCDGEVIGQKIIAINGGDWRVVQMSVTVDTAGEDVITVGDLSKTISLVD